MVLTTEEKKQSVPDFNLFCFGVELFCQCPGVYLLTQDGELDPSQKLGDLGGSNEHRDVQRSTGSSA